jgi:hypothetical protein
MRSWFIEGDLRQFDEPRSPVPLAIDRDRSMPSGYEHSPDYGGTRPLNPRRIIAVVVYIALFGVGVCSGQRVYGRCLHIQKSSATGDATDDHSGCGLLWQTTRAPN